MLEGLSATDLKRKRSEATSDDTETFKIQLSKKRLTDACVELVTINGRPFSLMDDSGFQNIVTPLVEAFIGNFRIYSSNVLDMVHGEAKIV